MSNETLYYLVLAVLAVLVLWVGWPRKPLRCQRCRRRLVEYIIRGEWVCYRCAEAMGRPAPQPGEHL